LLTLDFPSDGNTQKDNIMFFRMISLLKEIRQIFADAATLRDAMAHKHSRMGE
jgi:hypothetical protein